MRMLHLIAYGAGTIFVIVSSLLAVLEKHREGGTATETPGRSTGRKQAPTRRQRALRSVPTGRVLTAEDYAELDEWFNS
jgi:hypothetical protein